MSLAECWYQCCGSGSRDPIESRTIPDTDTDSDPQHFIRSHVVYFCPRYLEYAKEIIPEFLKESNVSEILFVPYALRDQVKIPQTQPVHKKCNFGSK